MRITVSTVRLGKYVIVQDVYSIYNDVYPLYRLIFDHGMVIVQCPTSFKPHDSSYRLIRDHGKAIGLMLDKRC